MAVIIGLVGEKGSGKGTFVRVLEGDFPETVSVVKMRFSDLHRETLALWNLEITRHNMQELSRVLVETYGMDVIANAMRGRIEHLQTDVVLLDGVRWEEDRKLIRSFPKNILVYITASPEVRFDRIRGRGENDDDHQASFEKFMREEQALSEQSIAAIGATADITIRNEGTFEEFRDQGQRVITQTLNLRRAIFGTPAPASEGGMEV
ncbi:MAG: AAA family ATPase [bacterium]|nr:AAA family ATPase [bacterium]